MGSTMVAVLLYGRKAYTVSIGDSRAYLWSEEVGVNLLHTDDNLINQAIVKGVPWDEVQEMESKNSLTRHLGMADVNQRPFRAVPLSVDVQEISLLEGESLLLCSDGLTDYLTPLGHRSDIWNADFQIDKILLKETNRQSSLPQQVNRLIEEANQNGGGDNITVMLIQVQGNKRNHVS
jgi:protein phosphatase